VLVGFKPAYLKDQLASFSALTLLVWSYDRKIVPDMTYNVLSGSLHYYCCDRTTWAVTVPSWLSISRHLLPIVQSLLNALWV